MVNVIIVLIHLKIKVFYTYLFSLFFTALKVDLDLKQSEVQQQIEKLRQHENRLMAFEEQLRKKEIEIDSKVQDVKIETENKYRVCAFISQPTTTSFFYSSIIFFQGYSGR